MSTSMTKGSPLKLMLQFALPLLMGNLLQQTYNIIDAAIVGQILGACKCWIEQQCTVSGFRLLYWMLCRFWRSCCQIFWRWGSSYYAKLHI